MRTHFARFPVTHTSVPTPHRGRAPVTGETRASRIDPDRHDRHDRDMRGLASPLYPVSPRRGAPLTFRNPMMPYEDLAWIDENLDDNSDVPSSLSPLIPRPRAPGRREVVPIRDLLERPDLVIPLRRGKKRPKRLSTVRRRLPWGRNTPPDAA